MNDQIPQNLYTLGDYVIKGLSILRVSLVKYTDSARKGPEDA